MTRARGYRGRRPLLFLLVLLPGGLGSCTAGPPPPSAGKGTLYGRLSLIPHAGVTPGTPGTTVYQDRKLRNIEFVDYGTPEPAVVYVETDRPATPLEAKTLTLEAAPLRSPAFKPPMLAVGAGQPVRVENRDGSARTLSCPEAGFLRTLRPGETAELPRLPKGPLRIFALDVPGAEAGIFVAPGPYALVTRSGAWELRDLEPGEFVLQAWHPRFPPARLPVTVTEGHCTRVELLLRVEDAGRGD
jgi:hypothetical protein